MNRAIPVNFPVLLLNNFIPFGLLIVINLSNFIKSEFRPQLLATVSI